MSTDEVEAFGAAVAESLADTLGDSLLGVWFVGSAALGGYVPSQSDLDIVAVSHAALTMTQRRRVAAAAVEAGRTCPARGLELTVYREEVAASPSDADFEVNVSSGPGMPTAVHLDAAVEPAFWYVLDRAVAHRAGVVISGPPAADVFADVPRRTLLGAMRESLDWHRVHEGPTLYTVLNACRAWRFAEEDVLVSKLEGAAWARGRWSDPLLIDAAVAQRRGADDVPLAASAVEDLLAAVLGRLAAEG